MAHFPRLTDIETVDEPDPHEARRTGIVVTSKLGHDCRDILEALGLANYTGHDRINRQSSRTPRPIETIRPGTLQQGAQQ